MTNNTPSPTISIAMTTFNGGRFLREQLDSIYAQSLLPYEVIVSDDGSTDDTIAILHEYEQRYGLVCHLNPSPLGIQRNFAEAIRMCHGDYIALSDQDDVWMPDKILTSFRQLEQAGPGPAVVSTQALDVDADLHPLVIKKYPVNQRLSSSIIFNTCSQGCSLMMNREFADRFLALVDTHPELLDATMHDALIGILAAATGKKINLPDSTFMYRHHHSNAIGKQNTHHSPKELIKLRPRYHYSLPDDRLSCLETLYPLIREQISQPEVHRLFREAIQMNATRSLAISLLRFLFMHDIPLTHKLQIILFSATNQILRHVFKN